MIRSDAFAQRCQYNVFNTESSWSMSDMRLAWNQPSESAVHVTHDQYDDLTSTNQSSSSEPRANELWDGNRIRMAGIRWRRKWSAWKRSMENALSQWWQEGAVAVTRMSNKISGNRKLINHVR